MTKLNEEDKEYLKKLIEIAEGKTRPFYYLVGVLEGMFNFDVKEELENYKVVENE